MKKITRIATIITLTSTGLSVFALPTITVIHKAVPYQNQAGYLEIRVGAFKPCTFISSKPVKAGSVFSVNLNDIAKYKQLGKNCTQQQIQSKVDYGYTGYKASVYYPALNLKSSCDTHFIRGYFLGVDTSIIRYLPESHFRKAGIVLCGFSSKVTGPESHA